MVLREKLHESFIQNRVRKPGEEKQGRGNKVKKNRVRKVNDE